MMLSQKQNSDELRAIHQDLMFWRNELRKLNEDGYNWCLILDTLKGEDGKPIPDHREWLEKTIDELVKKFHELNKE